ncbi:MAG: HU-CCDC81 and SPOR domain-containing protein [Bacteroidetes bacterium]|nr:HU-CCDC81 and SPOR domain-containing protein [Bacteroidota bacterium]
MKVIPSSEMNVGEYICELLVEHDCVIIPSFGGFVCNYSPAKIISGKNLFVPPRKKISFNRNLKNNDGLLANKISQEENISYREATDFMFSFVENLNGAIASEKHFELKNIGKFYLGEENILLFEQDETANYLPASFGMTAFYTPTIKRETLERKIKTKLEDRKITSSKQDTLSRKRIPLARYAAVAAFLLVVASLVFIFLKTDMLKNTNLANLNPFAEKIIPLYHSSEINLPAYKNKNSAENIFVNDTMHYLNMMLDEKIPVVVNLQEDKTIVKKTGNIKLKTSNRFYIIGGAFSIPENAQRLKHKLEKLGYSASILEKKLQLVSYGNYSSREEALSALEKIRTVQADAWLMKN